MVTFLIIIHIFFLIVLFLLSRIGILKPGMTMIPVILLVPVFGSLSAMLACYLERTRIAGTKASDLEVMKNSLVSPQEMPTREEEEGGSVPLEDALLIDDAQMKRSILLDVLMQDTDRYVQVLKEARMNEDTEVVHYATTAMVELLKEREMSLQKFAAMYAENPDQDGLLAEYINYIRQYIYSGMVDGQMLEIHRATYMQLLQDSIKKYGKKEDYFSYLDCLFENKDLSPIKDYLALFQKKWPQDEKIWEYRFRFAYENGDHPEMERLIAESREKEQYFSKKTKEIIKFWEANNNHAQ